MWKGKKGKIDWHRKIWSKNDEFSISEDLANIIWPFNVKKYPSSKEKNELRALEQLINSFGLKNHHFSQCNFSPHDLCSLPLTRLLTLLVILAVMAGAGLLGVTTKTFSSPSPEAIWRKSSTLISSSGFVENAMTSTSLSFTFWAALAKGVNGLFFVWSPSATTSKN